MNDFEEQIEKMRREIINKVNRTFNDLQREVTRYKALSNNVKCHGEQEYLITNTKEFKGKKINGMILHGTRIPIYTWKNAFDTILQDALKDADMKKRIYNLRDKLLGRVRKRLSSDPLDMRNPLMLDKDLYVETNYDTETLMNFLLQILDEIFYDYSDIYVTIKN